MTDIVERLRAAYPNTIAQHEAADEIERLRQRVKELEDYLREVAVEAGLPPETLDIATCRHIAHQVKAIRAGSIQFMNEAAELRKAQTDCFSGHDMATQASQAFKEGERHAQAREAD